MAIKQELNEAKSKLDQAQSLQELMKAANAVIRKKNLDDEEKVKQLMELELTEQQARKLLQPDFSNRVGFPQYRLTSNRQKIKTLEQRVFDLEKKHTAQLKGSEDRWEFDGGYVENNYDADRTQIFFDDIPDNEMRTTLKRSGWRWSPRFGAWQRKITDNAISAARRTLPNFKKAGDSSEKESSAPETSPVITPEQAEQFFKVKDFSYVSIYTSDAYRHKGLHDSVYLNIVVFNKSKVEAEAITKEWLEKELGKELADLCRINVYARTYIREAKDLFKKGFYLPSDLTFEKLSPKGYADLKGESAEPTPEQQLGIDIPEESNLPWVDYLVNKGKKANRASTGALWGNVRLSDKEYTIFGANMKKLPFVLKKDEPQDFKGYKFSEYGSVKQFGVRIDTPAGDIVHVLYPKYKNQTSFDMRVYMGEDPELQPDETEKEPVKPVGTKKPDISNFATLQLPTGESTLDEMRKTAGSIVLDTAAKMYMKHIKGEDTLRPIMHYLIVERLENTIGGQYVYPTQEEIDKEWEAVKKKADSNIAALKSGMAMYDEKTDKVIQVKPEDVPEETPDQTKEVIDQVWKGKKRKKRDESGKVVESSEKDTLKSERNVGKGAYENWDAWDKFQSDITDLLEDDIPRSDAQGIIDANNSTFKSYYDQGLSPEQAVVEFWSKDDAPTQPSEISLDASSYENQYDLNKNIEAWLEKHGINVDNALQRTYTEEEKTFLMAYSGYGGLKDFGTTGIGGAFEFYTPNKVIETMWALAYKNGYKASGSVLETSVGIGAFLQYASRDTRQLAYEINPYSAAICKILYPTAEVRNEPFEKMFIKNNYTIKDKTDDLEKFDLCIGNPPYGSLEALDKKAARYLIGFGEKDFTNANNYVEYFLRRSLDVLKPNGLLIQIVGAELKNGGQLFLDSKNSKVKDYLNRHAELVEAYRLPDSIFERTGVTSEILVIRKNK